MTDTLSLTEALKRPTLASVLRLPDEHLMNPQLATPTELRLEEGEGVESSVCEHCGRDVRFDPSDFHPAWFHAYNGGRVCGSST